MGKKLTKTEIWLLSKIDRNKYTVYYCQVCGVFARLKGEGDDNLCPQCGLHGKEMTETN